MVAKPVGGLMLAYSVVYTAHFIFDTLYDAGPVWSVFNIITAVGIILALAVNFAHMRAQAGSVADTVSRLGAYVLFYANTALAIWLFRNWVHLLALEEGERGGTARNSLEADGWDAGSAYKVSVKEKEKVLNFIKSGGRRGIRWAGCS